MLRQGEARRGYVHTRSGTQSEMERGPRLGNPDTGDTCREDRGPLDKRGLSMVSESNPSGELGWGFFRIMNHFHTRRLAPEWAFRNGGRRVPVHMCSSRGRHPTQTFTAKATWDSSGRGGAGVVCSRPERRSGTLVVLLTKHVGCVSHFLRELSPHRVSLTSESTTRNSLDFVCKVVY